MMSSDDGTTFWRKAFFVTALAYLILLPVLWFPLTSLLKPLPILCLLGLCLNSRLVTKSRHLLSVALIFSVCGDIALTLPLTQQLEVGLGLFLLAHCAYIRLFTRSVNVTVRSLLLSLALIIVSAIFFYWIRPDLAALQLPVALYLSVITLMAISAFLGDGHSRKTAFGALCFMGSDALIALNHFIYPASNFALMVMLGYYTAQYCIVTGVLSGASEMRPGLAV